MKSKNKVFSLIILLMVFSTMFFVVPKTTKEVKASAVSAITTIEAEEDEVCYADSDSGLIRYEKPLKGNTSTILTGDIVNLVVLFKFKDEKISGTMKYGDNNIDVALNNTLNNAPLSVKKYFEEVSLGKVNFHSFFVANKTNYLIAEAPYPRNYYLRFDVSNNPDGYSTNNKTSRRTELIRSVINQVDAFYTNNIESFSEEQINYFNSLDNNNDGKMDCVTLLYLNYGTNYSTVTENGDVKWQDLLWPHDSTSSSAQVNGYEVDAYSLMPQDRILTTDESVAVTIEGYGKIGNISTMCHETAHKFGIPDLYNYMEDEVEDAVSGWDLMSANHAPNPQYINSYLRYAVGWLNETNFEEIKYNGTYTLKPVSYAATTSNMSNYHNPIAYYIRGTGAFENQLIVFEYREFLGAFDGKDYTTNPGIPSNGLLIYRVDLGVTAASGYNSDIFPGNYGNSPYSIYYFRPQAEDGGEGVSSAAAFKDNASFGSVTEVINQITFQSYVSGRPQDVLLPEDVTYQNSNIVVTGINIANGEISFTVSADGLLINKEDEAPREIVFGVGGIVDRNLYDALLTIVNDTKLMSNALVGQTALVLNDKNIGNLTGLGLLDLSTIERIVLDANPITDGYSELLSIRNLKILQLSDMGLTDSTFMNNYYKNIYDLSKLTAIDVSMNELTNFEFAQTLNSATLKNILFNNATSVIGTYIQDTSYVIGPQNLNDLFQIGPYKFDFYYSPMLAQDVISLHYYRRPEVSENISSTRDNRVTASSFGTGTAATTTNFYNAIQVKIATSSPFYYEGINYSVQFFSIPIEVDTYLDIRYCGEGVFASDGITFDRDKFSTAFSITNIISRYAEDGSGDPTEVTSVDLDVVGRYEIYYHFVHVNDPLLNFQITKWVYVLSNDEITHQDMPDVNLYNALLSIVNIENGTNVSTLHSQDLARINYTNLELIKLNIENLAGLEKMNLETIVKLDITGNNVSTLAPLANMQALKNLFARSNNISDIEVLMQLPGLDLIDLSFNRLSDITVLSNYILMEGVNPTCINLNMNQIDIEDEANAFILDKPQILVLIQGLENEAHYINSVGYQYYQYEDITQGVSVKFKKGTKTQVMTNSNYLATEDGQYTVSINASSNSPFGSFNNVTYNVVVSTFSLAPIVYLENKFLETEDEVLVREIIRKPMDIDIIRNNTLASKGWGSAVNVTNNFNNFETYIEDENYIFFKINNELTDRNSYRVTYTVATYYKDTEIVCQTRDFTRTIVVQNNQEVFVSDAALKSALLEKAGKTDEDTLNKYDLYKVTDLDLSGKGIKNLYGIASLQFQNLTVLRLNNNEIETSGVNAKLDLLRVFKDLVLIDLSNNKISNAAGLHAYAPEKHLTIVLFNNRLAPNEDNRYCYEDIGALPGNLTVVTGLQCAEHEMAAFNQDVFFYYNPTNVNLISQRFSYGQTGIYDEESYKVIYGIPTPLDNAVFSYVYGIDVNIVFEIKIARGNVSVANNTIDVEVYSDFIDEELIYDGIPKSEYTVLNVEYRKDGELTKRNYLRNTELATFEQTFTVVLNSTQQPFAFSKWINVVDTTKPVVTLVGDSYIYLETGDEYEEFGIIVSDNYYKDIAIIKTIPHRTDVNTLEKGIYTLTYFATDGSGNVSEIVQRIVEVDYHDFLRFEIRGGDPLVYVGEATFEAYYMGLNTDHLGYLYYDPEPTFYWYVNGELVHTSKDLVFKYTPETAGRFDVELRINNKIMNAKVCSTELLVLFDDEVALYTTIGVIVGILLLIGIGIWIHIYRKKRREMYMEYSNETYRSARRK